MKNKVSNKTMTWLWQVSGKEKWKVFLLVLVQSFLGISSVLFAWLLRGGIDCAVAGDVDGFCLYAVTMTLLVFLQIAGRALKRFLDEYTKSGLENCLKLRMFESLITGEYARVAAVHSGEWMNRLTSDTVIVAEGLAGILPDVAGMLLRLGGAVAALLFLVPKLGYLIVPGGILLILFSTVSRYALKKMHTRIQEADGGLRVLISERLSGLLIVRIFAREKVVVKEVAEQMQKHRNARMKRNNFSNLCNIGLSLVINAVYMIGVLYCGYGILTGSVSYGSFMAVLQLIGQIQSPFANLTGYLPKFYAMLASAERLMEVETYERINMNKAAVMENAREFYRDRFVAMGFDGVSFTYLPHVSEKEADKIIMPIVLKNINFKINKGECVAFTGSSGSGKSTMLKLLMGLYTPDCGACYLEMAGGNRENIKPVYTRLFAYVPQGNQLMSGSIREIVAFSDETVSDDRIYKVLDIACALEFVKELPEGLDTRLGERGAGLSEGQMQRIAIARAICSENPILVLDEATSALDEVTEQKLICNLRGMTDRTVLFVTHRPAMLKLCNRQISLRDNHIEVT